MDRSNCCSARLFLPLALADVDPVITLLAFGLYLGHGSPDYEYFHFNFSFATLKSNLLLTNGYSFTTSPNRVPSPMPGTDCPTHLYHGAMAAWQWSAGSGGT